MKTKTEDVLYSSLSAAECVKDFNEAHPGAHMSAERISDICKSLLAGETPKSWIPVIEMADRGIQKSKI